MENIIFLCAKYDHAPTQLFRTPPAPLCCTRRSAKGVQQEEKQELIKKVKASSEPGVRLSVATVWSLTA